MWIQVDITLALYECGIINSGSGCLIPVKVSFDACAMVDVLVRRSFLKHGEKDVPFFC
jgi:hypothetical protein